MIRFFEEYEHTIKQLEFGEYFELLIQYVNSLFMVGNYQKHLEKVDLVIEASVMHNIKFFNGADIFHQMLFRKAASSFHMMNIDQADYILRELIKIDPSDNDSILFLKKCLRRRQVGLIGNTRGLSLLLFLLSAIIICLELLVIRKYFPHFYDAIFNARNTIFGMAWFLLIGGDLFHRWRTNKEVDDFVKKARRTER